VAELRRSYHDRISALRSQTSAIVHDAAVAVENVTAALLESDPVAAGIVTDQVSTSAGRAGAVETDVVEVLALQAPVARDLRIIVAALNIAQTATLCLGLCRTLAAKAGGTVGRTITPPLRALAYEMGAESAALLAQANGAWVVLDESLARQVIVEAAGCRDLHRRFLTELFGMSGLEVEAAVDLGVMARAYERLTDHVVDIAARVVYAETGTPPSETLAALTPS
jgi:phosphate transport system protein